MRKFYFIESLIIFLFLNSLLFSQKIDENWAPVYSGDKLVYVDLDGVKSFQGDEIYVWTIENHKPPFEIEGIDSEIYQTKTYYLINKKLKKYSILEIIYYDENLNVLKDYSYSNKSDDAEYKYGYPIFPGSLIDLVLNRCIREIEGQ